MLRRWNQDRPATDGQDAWGARRVHRGAFVLIVLALVLAVPSLAGKKSYKYEEDPVRLGTTALEEQRLQDAAKLFQEAIDNEWKLDRAYYGLAEILRRQDKNVEAEGFYRKAIQNHAEERNGATYPEASAGLGLSLVVLERFDEARTEFESALRDNKNIWDANYGMARVLIDQKRYSDALPYLEKGKGLKGVREGQDQYCYGTALAKVGSGDLTGAEKDALLALTLNPSRAEYGTLVAQIYTARNAPTLAIDAYEKALATPGVIPTPQVHQDLAQLYEGEREFNDALRHYLNAIEIDSTYAPAFKSAAKLYALGNQANQAGRFFMRYSQLAPNDAEGWSGQAEAFISLGANRPALEAAEKAYGLDSSDARIRLSLARSTYLANNLERSGRLYNSVADTTLYKVNDWVNLGQIALAQKGFLQADELFNKAIKLDPKNPDAYAAKGKYFLVPGRSNPDSAAFYYRKALEINPNSQVARMNLAVAFLQLRRPSDATQELRKVLVQSPNSVPAHIYLGQALVMADSLGAALTEYRKATELDPKSAPAWRGAGFVYLKRAEYGQAETVLLKSTALDPRSADGWASLGSAQAGLRKIDDGIKSFEKALEISPNHEGALRGLDALRQARAATGGK
jgi:tetratricopeptide (TPR) repeat protein